MLTAAERHQLLVEWNDTTRQDGPPIPHELFERTAEQQPEATAIVIGEKHLTYGELNNHANQLANYLIGLGVGRDARVCVCVERSAEFVTAVLAVLKAGAAYVPLDTMYPQGRLRFMLENSGAPVLLTRSDLCGKFAGCKAKVVLFDEDREAIASQSVTNPASRSRLLTSP